jgi:ribosome maturation factor RimP
LGRLHGVQVTFSRILESGRSLARFFFYMAKVIDKSVVERVRQIAEPLAASMGLEVVEIEYLREGRWVLRLFIDKVGGVMLDDCSAFSHALAPALDVEDVGDSGYSLEVSSPGLDRPLRRPEDFRKYAGKKAKVRTYGPLQAAPELSPRKSFSGTLLGCTEGADPADPKGLKVELDVDGKHCAIPLADIAKAHLVYDFSEH